jgi:hypothetical protein
VIDSLWYVGLAMNEKITMIKGQGLEMTKAKEI